MKILTVGNELLREKARPIEKIGTETAELATGMIELMRQGKGVGLAGPQIGVMRRIFVIHIEGDEPRVFINPSIIETSEKQNKMEEGCLSIPGVWADVVRSASVTVQAWNEKGRRFILEADGIVARVIQHEYDHLDGVLFVDRLPELKRNRILAKYQKMNNETEPSGGEKAP